MAREDLGDRPGVITPGSAQLHRDLNAGGKPIFEGWSLGDEDATEGHRQRLATLLREKRANR